MTQSLKVDPMGRIVLPARWRRRHGVLPGSRVEVVEEPEGLFIKGAPAGPALIREGELMVHIGKMPAGETGAVARDRERRDRRNWGL